MREKQLVFCLFESVFFLLSLLISIFTYFSESNRISFFIVE